MTTVIQFGRPQPPEPPKDDAPELIWVCRCGCKTFKLYADGHTECAGCGHHGAGPEDALWRSKLPDPPPNPQPEEPDGDNTISIQNLATSGAALQHVLRKADPEETSIVIILQTDGGVSIWGGIDGDEQDGWFDRRIAVAKKLLISKA